MRRLLSIVLIGLAASSCAALMDGLNNLNQTASSFTPSIEMKQLDQWGNWVPSNGYNYTIDNRPAAVRFYPGREARIVSLEAFFDGNPRGVSGDYIITLPDRHDHLHELLIRMVLKPVNGDPVPKTYKIQLDYLERH